MAGKSVEQRMVETEERIRQLEARKRTLAHQLSQQDRKERTRRLIQIGGIMARLGVDSVEKAQALQRIADRNPKVKAWLSGITAPRRVRNALSPHRLGVAPHECEGGMLPVTDTRLVRQAPRGMARRCQGVLSPPVHWAVSGQREEAQSAGRSSTRRSGYTTI